MNLISIVMSVRNEQDHLSETLTSILHQTYSKWELIIVDDGSTDKTSEIIHSHAIIEKASFISIPKSIGLPAALNLGCKKAKGNLIARIDGDDVMHASRLDQQLKEFKSNDKLILCGSNADVIDKRGRLIYTTNMPVNDFEIRPVNLIRNCFVHPSVMFRHNAQLINEGIYDETFKTTQDWMLWSKLLKYGECKNIQEALISYRKHDRSTTSLHHDFQIKNSIRCQAHYFKNMFPKDEFKIECFEFINKGLMADKKALQTNYTDTADTAIRTVHYFLNLFSENKIFWKPAIILIFSRVLRLCFHRPWKAQHIKLLWLLISNMNDVLQAIFRLLNEKFR